MTVNRYGVPFWSAENVFVLDRSDGYTTLNCCVNPNELLT